VSDVLSIEQIRERIKSGEMHVSSFYHIESYSDIVLEIIREIIVLKTEEARIKHCQL
jgi:hypothetical protein